MFRSLLSSPIRCVQGEPKSRGSNSRKNLSPEYLGFDMKAVCDSNPFQLAPGWIRLPPVNLDKYAGRTRKLSEMHGLCSQLCERHGTGV